MLEQTCEELQAEGLECGIYSCDIREPDQVEALMTAIQQRYGQLDLLVNNAAGNFPAPISGISYKGFKTIVDIDLLGTYNVTKAAFERFLKESGGGIVNISAPFQHGGASYQAHVAAAKAGVDSLTRTCAVEFGACGVRVNAVAPGATGETEGMERFAAATGGQGSHCPLGFVGSKDDIANAVLFFLLGISFFS